VLTAVKAACHARDDLHSPRAPDAFQHVGQEHPVGRNNFNRRSRSALDLPRWGARGRCKGKAMMKIEE